MESNKPGDEGFVDAPSEPPMTALKPELQSEVLLRDYEVRRQKRGKLSRQYLARVAACLAYRYPKHRINTAAIGLELSTNWGPIAAGATPFSVTPEDARLLVKDGRERLQKDFPDAHRVSTDRRVRLPATWGALPDGWTSLVEAQSWLGLRVAMTEQEVRRKDRDGTLPPGFRDRMELGWQHLHKGLVAGWITATGRTDETPHRAAIPKIYFSDPVFPDLNTLRGDEMLFLDGKDPEVVEIYKDVTIASDDVWLVRRRIDRNAPKGRISNWPNSNENWSVETLCQDFQYARNALGSYKAAGQALAERGYAKRQKNAAALGGKLSAETIVRTVRRHLDTQ